MADFLFKAALFDLDGVIFDTEPQYSVFWGGVCRSYHPELPGLENRIKGQTLNQIFDGFFKGSTDVQNSIVNDLDRFEADMQFDYVRGFEPFISQLRAGGIATAIVTSSNMMKMNAVYRKRPEVLNCFDAILTSEDFTESKPSPQCYVRAARRLGVPTSACVVFEDSFNGLRAGMASGATVVGLATTNARQDISGLCHMVTDDFAGLRIDDVQRLVINRTQ